MHKYRRLPAIFKKEAKINPAYRGKTLKRRLHSTAVLSMLILSMLPIFSSGEAQTSTEIAPFMPHEVRVLAVSPADVYYGGAHYLVSDLARYGFNVTHYAANDAVATDYLNDPRTSDLSQYDVIIIQGILGFSGSRVSLAEVAHFTNYRGILILMGNALFQNETSNDWWGFDSEPVRSIEQRLGVDFLDFSGRGGAWHNGGEFELLDYAIGGLPLALSYSIPLQHNGIVSFQVDLTTETASEIYDFTITSSPSTNLIGKQIAGVTYYKAQDNAVGIFIQGGYVYGTRVGTYDINYHGLTDISTRSSLLASLIAAALEKDVTTIIKPQPLANIRLSGLGYAARWDEMYLNASLANFYYAISACNITPTIAFAEIPRTFDKDYWRKIVPITLAQLNGKYRDWEYSSSLRSLNTSGMTQSAVETLIQDVRANYTALGIDLFSTVATSVGLWNQATLDAMANKGLYLIDSVGEASILERYSSDWWNMKTSSGVAVHYSVQMASDFEDFDQISNSSLYYRYYSNRQKWMLAVLNGFPSFAYNVPNFRWNEVGTYSLQTVYRNLTAEIPDIRFVPLIEGGLYFGNRWMRTSSATRFGRVIEFDVDTSLIPEAVDIGKGMLWVRINANESIQEVSVDNSTWFYFDEHSIRVPATKALVHVKVTLGNSPNVRVAESRYKVIMAQYDGQRFNVSIDSNEKLNVSVRLFLPQIGPFSKNTWSVFCLETEWNYNFSLRDRMLTFWCISDGLVSFEAGAFWVVDQTTPWYHSNVVISANFSGLEIRVTEVVISYSLGDLWKNVTMVNQDGVYVFTLPALRYGTEVSYRMFVFTDIGKWVVTAVYGYSVIDEDPPELDGLEWQPTTPFEGQSVNVRISLNEPENASGVGDVVLRYHLGSDVTDIAKTQSIAMKNESGVWTAEIPGHGGGSLVTFYVDAYDKAGNKAQTAPERYTVMLPISSLILIIGVIVAIVVVGIGATLYLRKSRKRNKQLNSPETKP